MAQESQGVCSVVGHSEAFRQEGVAKHLLLAAWWCPMDGPGSRLGRGLDGAAAVRALPVST